MTSIINLRRVESLRMEGKWFIRKTPSGDDPKVYSEQAKERIDSEMRYDVENGYNQRVSVLSMLTRLSEMEFKYLEIDRPELIDEFKMLFPDTELNEANVKELFMNYVTNEKQIKLDKMRWAWEEVTVVEE